MFLMLVFFLDPVADVVFLYKSLNAWLCETVAVIGFVCSVLCIKGNVYLFVIREMLCK